jgi:diguanylate cyclase (GGDEF)-like protein/PAS domain S-box-containing protein
MDIFWKIAVNSPVASSLKTVSTNSWTKNRLRRFAEILPCMLYEYVLKPDGSSEFLFVGTKCRELLELNENELLADANLFWKLVLEEDLLRLKSEDLAANAEGISFSAEVRIKTKSGCVKWIQLSSRPNPASVGEMAVWSGFMLDITGRKNMEEQVRQLAFYDTLTNLANRRLLNDRLIQAMSASHRSGAYGAILVIDLDNFKPINDKHGHLVGDALLVEAAARLKSSVRSMDTVGRFGGDEFVVMLSELSTDEVDSKIQAGAVAEKIRITLAKPYVLTVQHAGQSDVQIEHHCTACIGAVLFKGKSVCQDTLFERADAAMYLGKEAGRDQIRFCDVEKYGQI